MTVTNFAEFRKWAKESDGVELPLIDELAGFKTGQRVTYTNDYGVKFYGLEIWGFGVEPQSYGGQVYLGKDSYWFPVPVSSIKAGPVFDSAKKYKTDSELGGSFSLKFMGRGNGTYVFRITNPDFQREITFTETTISKVQEQ